MQTQMRASQANRLQGDNEVFAKIDTANKGSIDEGSFETAVKQAVADSQSNQNFSTNQIQAAFKSLDTNGDGQVTQQEFANALSSPQGHHHHHRHQQTGDLSAEMPAMMAMQGMGQMPPPPGTLDTKNGGGADKGFTIDELKSQLTEIGTSDPKRSSLINNVLTNFSKADVDGDGKVSFKEAMDLERSLKSTNSTTTTTSDATTASTADVSQQQYLRQMMNLLQTYGVKNASSASNGTSVNVTA